MKSIVELASDNWRSLAQKAHTLCHAGGKLIRSDLRNGRNKQALLTAEKILVGLKDSGKRWSSEIGSRQTFSSLASKIPVLDEKRQVSFLEKMFHFQVAPFIAPFSLQRVGDYERIKNYLDDSISLFQELTGDGRVGRDLREYLAGVLVDVLWNTVSVPIRDEATLELIDLKARKKCVQNFIRFSKELSETNQVRLQYAYDTLVSVQSELARRRALE
jgi:hypothetical protein